MDERDLLTLVEMKMPFGKYRDVPLLNLPHGYLAWFRRQGLPKGKLGEYLTFLLQLHEEGGIDELRAAARRSRQ